jgi:hypothetical protein
MSVCHYRSKYQVSRSVRAFLSITTATLLDLKTRGAGRASTGGSNSPSSTPESFIAVMKRLDRSRDYHVQLRDRTHAPDQDICLDDGGLL